MTDNEIIKAFKCCYIDGMCNDCPAHNKKDCRGINASVLDLINRQKAEIERLEKDSKRLKKVQMQLDDAMKMYSIIKAEAVKEFAERLNKEAEKVGIDREGDFVETDDKIYDTVANWCKATSNNLVKEMVGDAD